MSRYPWSGATIQLVRIGEGWFEVEVSFWTQIPVCDFVIIEKLTFDPHRWKEKLIVWEAGAVLVHSGERGEHLGWG